MEKYYTPSLEEFNIGFEYETYNTPIGYIITDFSEGDFNYSEVKTPNEKMWFKENFRLPCMPLDTWSDLKEINKRIEEGRIRVKYLDETDLIELGWYIDEKGITFSIEGGFWMVRIIKEGVVNLHYVDNLDWEVGFSIYKCQVKNKTEMKKLMQMLNIKPPEQN